MNATTLIVEAHEIELPRRPFATVHDANVGDRYTWSRHYHPEDIENMGKATRDRNPIHFSREYAEKTRFKRPILHGVSAIGEISRVLGMEWPGRGSIFAELNVKFKGAVYPGDTVHYIAEITEIEVHQSKLKISVVGTIEGRPVLVGSSLIFLEKDTE